MISKLKPDALARIVNNQAILQVAGIHVDGVDSVEVSADGVLIGNYPDLLTGIKALHIEVKQAIKDADSANSLEAA